MRYIFFHVIFLFLTLTSVRSQHFIDTVYDYQWGTGWQVTGRDSAYFPNNIFGPPTSTATKYISASSDYDVVELGHNGWIVVGNKGHYIVDKPGPDFVIFENVFCYGNDRVFAEPAIVSVSKDGVEWIQFPFDSESLLGLAGISWTNGNQNPFDYPAIGGDAFDLSTIGIDSVLYIRIKDTALITSTLPQSNIYYQPAGILTGFDLDAVVLLHTAPINSNTTDLLMISENDQYIFLDYGVGTTVMMYDIYGRTVAVPSGRVIDKRVYPIGFYLLVASKNDIFQHIKIVIVG